jgi:hypothetical protein
MSPETASGSVRRNPSEMMMLKAFQTTAVSLERSASFSSPYLSPLFCQSGLNRPGRKSAVLIQWRHQSLHQVPEPRRFHDVSGLCP